jgi:PKD repeat protein
MVVENQHQTERIPAAVGVICASDANDPETRVLTEQEQTVIENVVQQFITIRNIQKTNITQVVNIINNITTNQTGGGGNQTGNQTDGGNQTSPITVIVTRDIGDGTAAPALWSLEADAHGGVPPYTYSWDFGDGTTGEGCCPDHVYETPGDYVATVTATDAVGNTGSDSVRIGVDIPIGLKIHVEADLIEGPEAPATYSFTVLMYDPISNNRSESDYTYQWDFGDGQTSDSPGRTTTHTYENPGVYFPEVTVTDPEGNTAFEDEGRRIVVPAAEFEVQITRDIQDGTEAPSTWCFEPSIVTGAEGVPPYTYSWDFGDGTTSSDKVCHTFQQPGDYEVTLDVRDSAGGEASATTTIRVLPPLETAPETEQPATTEGETTTTPPETPPETTTEGEEGAATTDTTTETPPSATEEGAGAAEEPPAGTTTITGGEDATTPP